MQQSYTLEELAEFLNRSVKEVQRMAEKEELKGRKARGTWTFALPDVVLWMERELTKIKSEKENDLENVVPPGDEDLALSELIGADLIDLNFRVRTKSSVINEIVKLGERASKLWDSDAMARALREREEMASTALENGVAIMHPRRPQTDIVAEDFLALGLAPSPIPFGGGFNNETDVFFLLCCRSDASYLRALGKLAKALKTPGFLDALRDCSSADDAYALIVETEEKI